MRRSIFFLLLSLCSITSFAQSRMADSLERSITNSNNDTNRVKGLIQLARVYLYEKPLTGIEKAQEGLALAKQLNYEQGIGATLNAMGNCYRMTGSYTKALEIHLEALRIFEKLKNEEGIAYSYHGISTVYEDQDIYKESLEYAHKVIPIAQNIGNKGLLMRIQSNMGRSFEKINQLDSALHYEQNAYEIALGTKDSSIVGNILGRIGNIHYKTGNTEMALLYYKMGLPVATARNDNNSLYELNQAVAKLFHEQGRYDSSIYYSKQALLAAQLYANPGAIVTVTSLLSRSYDRIGKTDSAYKYQGIAITTKDTLITRDKVKQMQLMAFEEEKRQKELADGKIKAAADRKHHLEYAVIAVAIISILIVFLLLSRSIVVNARFIIFLGAVALLLFFEFINLLLHPFLESITNHSPALMLIALAVIAAILVPFHHRLEKWIKTKMVEKNKIIRLAAAKKTIADLEAEAKSEE